MGITSHIEVRDFPARDICFLHVVLQGSHQMGRIGESCWDVAAAVAAVSHLEIQVDILAGELYLEFVPMELGPGGSSGRFETGVLHRISIPFRWAEWFGLGSHF